MPDQTPAQPLNTQYATQVADDLERITARIGVVGAELAALQADQALLERVRASIEDVPAPRQAPDDAPASPIASTHEGARQKKSDAPVTATATAGKSRAPRRPARHASGPTLVDLVLRHLSAQSEDRGCRRRGSHRAGSGSSSAPPVRSSGAQCHRSARGPGRDRPHQAGRSVFYSAVGVTGADSASDSDSAEVSK